MRWGGEGRGRRIEEGGIGGRDGVGEGGIRRWCRR